MAEMDCYCCCYIYYYYYYVKWGLTIRSQTTKPTKPVSFTDLAPA